MATPVPVDLATLTHATFAAHQGTAFELRLADGKSVPLTLAEVRKLGANRSANGAKREAFSLTFRAPTREFYVPQQVVALDHAALGRIELFVVPIGPDQTGMRFEAIFA